jgi:UDP:flavonoid glycosyltransferase YjiC (YdhE family)
MNENAARVDWAGVGVRLPRRYVSARPLRLAVMRAVEDAGMRERAERLAGWADGRDPGQYASASIEELARRDATVSRGTFHP